VYLDNTTAGAWSLASTSGIKVGKVLVASATGAVLLRPLV
jgi:hypothetical protein